MHEEGTVGHRERNDIVVYQNGMEISREMVHENIITESKAAVIEQGTVIPPTYIKPLAGRQIRLRDSDGAGTYA